VLGPLKVSFAFLGGVEVRCRKVVGLGPVGSMHSVFSMDTMFAMAASLRTWHDFGEMICGISLVVPLNSSDDDPFRDSFLPAAVPSPSQHLRSAALY
jgi:hypothetical protein